MRIVSIQQTLPEVYSTWNRRKRSVLHVCIEILSFYSLHEVLHWQLETNRSEINPFLKHLMLKQWLMSQWLKDTQKNIEHFVPFSATQTNKTRNITNVKLNKMFSLNIQTHLMRWLRPLLFSFTRYKWLIISFIPPLHFFFPFLRLTQCIMGIQVSVVAWRLSYNLDAGFCYC